LFCRLPSIAGYCIRVRVKEVTYGSLCAALYCVRGGVILVSGGVDHTSPVATSAAGITVEVSILVNVESRRFEALPSVVQRRHDTVLKIDER
jgi:hypothetical protein